MDHAIVLARIFGPFFTIIALWVLLRGDHVMEIATAMKKSPALLCMGGIINLLIGLSILAAYPTWSMSLFVILPILGWLQLIRGILILFAPKMFMEMAMSFQSYWPVLAYIPLVLGLCLTYAAFI